MGSRTWKSLPCLVVFVAAALSSASAAPPPKDIELVPLGTYASGVFNQAAATIVAHDPATQRLFVVNQSANGIDVLDISDPSLPVKLGAIDLTPFGGVPTSVASRDGLVAVAKPAAVITDPGLVLLYDEDLELLSSITVGAFPDLLTFSPNGRWLLVANEGEPNDDYTVDPEGSVTIIDVSGDDDDDDDDDVRTVGFTAFNGAALDPSIRIFGPGATVAQDLEPESIAVSPDSKTAWVTLQENNAMAVIDIRDGVVTELVGLGFKDHSLPGNGLDPSDRDSATGSASVKIGNWPLKGAYQPDEVAAFRAHGEVFLVLANEGGDRQVTAFDENVRVGDAAYVLDPVAFANAADLKLAKNLGRLRASKATGDLDGDGDFDEIHTFGGRSFSIRAADGSLVFDSGDDFERITAAVYPNNFNASNTGNALDSRSPTKGPEPEGITVGKAFGRMWAFIGSERIGGIFVYDVTEPAEARFVQYINNRDLSISPNAMNFAAAGDLGPEGLVFIKEEDSPIDAPLLVVGNEVSGTTTIFEVRRKR
jgi:DNA-binding beta-propeller fold protein YncE